MDFAHATSCYSNWRLDRSLPVQAVTVPLEPDQESGALSETLPSDVLSVPPPPVGYRLAKAVDLHLFCGTEQVAWDRIRIPSTFRPPPVSQAAGTDGPQLYALEVVDAVNEECILDWSSSIPESDMEKDMGKLMKMVKRVPAYDGIVFTIEAADI